MRVIKGRIARCYACNCYIEYTNDDLEIVLLKLTDEQKEMIEKTNENSIFKHMVPTLRYLKCPYCSYVMQV